MKGGRAVEQVGVNTKTPGQAGKLTRKGEGASGGRGPIGCCELSSEVAKALGRSF